MRDQSTFERVLECSSFASAPAALERLLPLFLAEDTALAAVEGALAPDAGLAARLVKLAGAPDYSPGFAITSLKQALPIFGARGALALALTSSVHQRLASMRRVGVGPRFWQRAVLTAVTARELARLRQHDERDDLFAAGFFAELGVLALAEVLREGYDTLTARARHDHALLARAERERLGFDHADVGARILERWGFPARTFEVVRSSHEEHTGEGREHAYAGRLLRVASAIAELWLDEEDVETVARRAFERSEYELGLGYDELLELNERVRMVAADVAELYQPNLVFAAELDGVADRAREALVGLSIQATVLEEQRAAEVEAREMFDVLTGLLERNYVEDALAGQLRASEVAGAPIALLFCDLDHLAAVNERHGQDTGDAVLRAVGKVVMGSVRDTDLVGRWGGEELVVVLSGVDRSVALAVAERLRTRIAALEVPAPGGAVVRPTASFGVAMSGTADGHLALVEEAMQAVRVVKAAGGDRVALWRESGAAVLPGAAPRLALAR